MKVKFHYSPLLLFSLYLTAEFSHYSDLPKDILHTYSRLAPLTWNISCRYRRIIIIRVVRVFFAHLLNR